MSSDRFDPNDPRLTAYVFDELDEAERVEVERCLETCAETRAAVEEIRRTAGVLTEALSREPAPSLEASQRAAIEAEAVGTTSQPAKPVSRRSQRATVAVIAGLLALTATVVIVLRPSTWQQADKSESEDMKIASPADSPLEVSYSQSSTVGIGLDNQTLREREKLVANADRAILLNERAARLKLKPQEKQLFASKEITGLTANRKSGSGDAGYGGSAAGGYGGVLVTPDDAKRRQTARSISLAPRGKQVGVRSHLTTLRPADTPSGKSGPGSGIAGAKDAKKPDPNWHLGVPLVLPLEGNSNTESYTPIVENDFLTPLEHPRSTFSIDVDTASYSNMRRFLKAGRLPPADAVRIEELVNYFQYDYPQPTSEHPFSVNMEAAACPWNADHRLVRIGLKGREIPRDKRPPSSLVFLIDASGSMRDQNKLPLVKAALEMLVAQMTEDDRISIITYSGQAGLLLPSTSGHDRETILAAIARLNAGGSTNGEAGIKLAYDQALQYRIEDGSNRIILCTDGDFNVGVSDDDQLVRMVQDYAKQSRVFLSIFGFGMGNLKDSKLEKLADKGNGHYAYIDSRREAEIVFVEEMTGMLYTIAKDVKIQVEFNPAHVGAYRLIGYENRVLQARDFNDDTKDAGEIGAGHTVTALYEIVPPDKLPKEPEVDPLRYQKRRKPDAKEGKASDELLTLKLRYKPPEGDKSISQEFPLVDKGEKEKAARPSRDFQWAAAVAAFGMVVRDSQHKGRATLETVRELAVENCGPDTSGRRREFIELIDLAREIQRPGS